MTARTFLVALLLGALCAAPAAATLAEGTSAPLFTAPATLGTEVFTFDLAAALRKGPVVLYFYPAAFTEGCTQEAHDFAENIERYKKLGATVIGISGDDLEKLKRFATSECRSKFPVAADKDLKIAKSYDATLAFQGDLYANRVSYVIARDGTIAYAYSALDPDRHVANTLEALRKLKR
ncbi:MAG: peroxiredoxin [Candidatus Eremiobacteraeota bacterium]|nr:peroxiredoxin [Candidatus Eremiobacteraeota bacterium]